MNQNVRMTPNTEAAYCFNDAPSAPNNTIIFPTTMTAKLVLPKS